MDFYLRLNRKKVFSEHLEIENSWKCMVSKVPSMSSVGCFLVLEKTTYCPDNYLDTLYFNEVV